MYRLVLLLCLGLLTLSGCGQKGPLYIPDEEQELRLELNDPNAS